VELTERSPVPIASTFLNTTDYGSAFCILVGRLPPEHRLRTVIALFAEILEDL